MMENIGNISSSEIEKLQITFSYLNMLNNDMSNLDEIGMTMLRKYIRGKKKYRPTDRTGAMVYYIEKHKSAGAARANKPGDKKCVWSQVKEEVYKLLCTKDKRYTKVRQKLFIGTKHLCNTMVITISAIIAKAIGVITGVISGAVAALFFAIGAIGVATYCNIYEKP